MIYSRLLSLYKAHKNNGKTPLEDFTTEILVGILEENQEILEAFVSEILKIEGSNYSIDSQVKYKVEDDKDCIIDIVIKNDDTICFVENKVNSAEGERQLERYTTLLQGIEKNNNKNIYLRYCTKHYDKKEIPDIDFLQYRWSNVYNFLLDYQDNNLILEYLEFLEGENMSSAGEFNYEDLIVMSRMNSTIAKMDECLDNVKDTLITVFDKPYERDLERLKEVVRSQNYTMWTTDIIGNTGSKIVVGFTFQEDLDTVAPFLSVDFRVECNNDKYDKIKLKKKEIESIFEKDYSEDDYILLSFEKSLSDFISKDNQISLMCDWFNEKIYEVKKSIDLILE